VASNRDHLIDVLHIGKEYPLAVEARHKSWSDPSCASELC
jgi:uncharacterized protein YecE (DUF72 family)